jgi:hypothetical protein
VEGNVMDRKKLIIIAAIVLTIFFALLIVFLFSKNQKNREVLEKVPVFTPSPTIKSNYSNKDLSVASIDPTEDVTGKNNYSPIRRIIIVFNKTVKQDTLNIQISPEIKTKATFDATQLIIQPEPPLFWTPNTIYTITIKQGLVAQDGAVMKDDYVYRIQAKSQGGE